MKRTLIALLILTVATTAFAAPGRGPGGPGADRGPQGPGPQSLLPPPAIAEFLGLTEAQVAQIQSLREQLEATVQPLAEQQRANQQAIEEALAAGNAARVGELMLANYNLRSQMKAAHDAFKAGFEGVLTAAQQAKWAVYNEIVELRRQRPE
jgi:Spy/CpxP family protein refolding chaperone